MTEIIELAKLLGFVVFIIVFISNTPRIGGLMWRFFSWLKSLEESKRG